jgi:excisionase family DNA binding protein
VNTQPLLTTREVATLLGLSPATVLRRWRSGEIPGYRLSANVLRFSPVEVERWLEAHREGERPGNAQAAYPPTYQV